MAATFSVWPRKLLSKVFQVAFHEWENRFVNVNFS